MNVLSVLISMEIWDNERYDGVNIFLQEFGLGIA